MAESKPITDQHPRAPAEVLIVDNASGDETLALARELAPDARVREATDEELVVVARGTRASGRRGRARPHGARRRACAHAAAASSARSLERTART